MKVSVPFFLSYAHGDKPDVERFLDVRLKTSTKYDIGMWRDTAILPGEKWREEIDAALGECRFGILCVTPKFLDSEFITGVELPLLLARPLVVPVCIHQVAFDGSIDLKGLENRQLFRDSKGRPFDACRTMPDRRKFALELHKTILALLEKYPC